MCRLIGERGISCNRRNEQVSKILLNTEKCRALLWEGRIVLGKVGRRVSFVHTLPLGLSICVFVYSTIQTSLLPICYTILAARLGGLTWACVYVLTYLSFLVTGVTGHSDQPACGGGTEPVLSALSHPCPQPQVYHHGGAVRGHQQTHARVVRRTHGHDCPILCNGRGNQKLTMGELIM